MRRRPADAPLIASRSTVAPRRRCTPAPKRYRITATGEERRHHLHEPAVQKALKAAVRKAGRSKHATGHRSSFATPLLANGYNICTVPDPRTPLGQSTLIYILVLNLLRQD